MIQVLYAVISAQMALILTLLFNTPLRKLVILTLDRLKRGQGPVMVKTVGATILVVLMSSVYSMLKIQSRTIEAGVANPTDQVLMSKLMLEASLMGELDGNAPIEGRVHGKHMMMPHLVIPSTFTRVCTHILSRLQRNKKDEKLLVEYGSYGEYWSSSEARGPYGVGLWKYIRGGGDPPQGKVSQFVLGSGFCDTVNGGSLQSKYPSWEVDKLVWTPSPTQGFQVKSYCRILRGVVNFFLGKASGKSGSHHGWAFFSWCAALGRILIADNLRKSGTILMEWCYIYVVFSRGVGWGLVRGVGGDLESCSVMRNVVYWGERNAWFFEGARNEYGEAKICDFEILI
uniref:Endoplasmic reticulum transmembrane protein n=1 Tax=Fagus sylvatica TaxID=28930 RepID=A0A2N9I531_FAGSY